MLKKSLAIIFSIILPNAVKARDRDIEICIHFFQFHNSQLCLLHDVTEAVSL